METDSGAAKCRYPILLLHGLFGFVERRVGPFRLVYFRGVIPYLEAAGNQVFALTVPPVQNIEVRAQTIASLIDVHPVLSGSRINVVGHSMGGVDGRFLASRLDPDHRIASLTTLASPHRGSWLADIIDSFPLLGKSAARWMPGIHDLTEKSMARLNEELPDREDVAYFSIPSTTSLWKCTPLMWPLYTLMWLHDGANDGQVSRTSGSWGEVIEEAQADHFEMIGMRLGLNRIFPFDHLAMWGRLTRFLAERGC